MLYRRNAFKVLIIIGFVILLITLAYLEKDEAIFYWDSDDDLSFWFRDMETLVDKSDYIVVCRRDESLDKEEVIISESKREVVLAFTSTPVRVEKIIKGDGTFSQGSQIQIAEPYFLYSEFMKDRTYKTINGYRPMQNDQRYLLFLITDNWDQYYYFKGAYEPIGYFQGKIPMAYIESVAYSEEDLKVDEIALQNHYKIHQQILAIRKWWQTLEVQGGL